MTAPALHQAAAFAPASVGNLGVGFDILGQAIAAVGDTVRIRATDTRQIRIASITGSPTELPKEPERNTATVGLLGMQRELGLPFGMEVSIEKGIPIGAGMGGSAASAVAAVVAANALLDEPLEPARLLAFALAGEAEATGSMHVDNVAPSLYGGIVLSKPSLPSRVTRIPAPAGVCCVVVYPELYIETKNARSVLKDQVPLVTTIEQSYNLAGFIAGCFSGDLDLIRSSLSDVLIEPQRARLIPGFPLVKKAALAGGALGCSISGSGPSVFAWCKKDDVQRVAEDMVAAFAGEDVAAHYWISPAAAEGARLVDSS